MYSREHVVELALLAKDAMYEWDLEPELPQDARNQLDTIQKPAQASEQHHDLRHLLWASIDNDDSRDLDQLTYSQKEADGTVSVWVAIADVDALVKKNSPIDVHAQKNTTTVYTPAVNFPMLPEKLSTDLTSLNEHEERLAVVVEIALDPEGSIVDSHIKCALVKNHAKLTYHAVGAWLEREGDIPPKVMNVQGLDKTLKLQSDIAILLRKKRSLAGALSLETLEPKALFKEDHIVGMVEEKRNLAHELIEEFMILANTTVARYLANKKIPSFRRVVRVPKRWDRIVEVAKECGQILPFDPDSKALDAFLVKMKSQDPDSFYDLSLTIIKLLGSGEYVVEYPGATSLGHFGLALKAYTHSTAPNRRYPDLITQRQLKAALDGNHCLYQGSELEILARHCTTQEDNVAKLERRLMKSAAALLLSNQIGKTYRGIVTGAAEKGTWVRIFDPLIEGKVVQGMKGLDVGDRILVRLLSVDVAKGFIDFARTG